MRYFLFAFGTCVALAQAPGDWLMHDRDAAETRFSPLNQINSAARSTLTPAPVDLGPDTDQLFLVIFGSGLGGTTTATATVGSADAAVAYAGTQGTFAGPDQFNILLPRSLAGKGTVEVVIRAGGRPSNAVYLTVQ